MSYPCCAKTAANKRRLKLVAKLLKNLAEPNRLKIMCLLKAGPTWVNNLSQELNLPQNLISHHLAVLRQAGLVTSQRRGLRAYYRLDRAVKNQLLKELKWLLADKTNT